MPCITLTMGLKTKRLSSDLEGWGRSCSIQTHTQIKCNNILQGFMMYGTQRGTNGVVKYTEYSKQTIKKGHNECSMDK